MLCDNTPVIEALSGSVFVFALPQVEDILKCFVADKSAVAQGKPGVIVVENTLDIFGTGRIIRISLIEVFDFFL